MIELELMKRTKAILEKLGKVSLDDLPYCKKMTKWQLNEFCEKAGDRKIIEQKLRDQFGKVSIRQGEFTVQKIDERVYLVAGGFYTCPMDSNSNIGKKMYAYDVDVIFRDGFVDRVILHCNYYEPILHTVKEDEEHFYMLHESEIIYIDCERNNCIWHCSYYDVRERITLKRVEESLSASFCRIGKSCIVNMNHIHRMNHYELVMDNGESLFISRRFYKEVKSRILEFLN